MSELLLGVDIGTSSSKGVLAGPDGEVIATAVRPHMIFRYPAPGGPSTSPKRYGGKISGP